MTNKRNVANKVKIASTVDSYLGDSRTQAVQPVALSVTAPLTGIPVHFTKLEHLTNKKKGKAVPLYAMKALGGRGGIAPTHSRPRH
jgi:hypothetical protein